MKQNLLLPYTLLAGFFLLPLQQVCAAEVTITASAGRLFDADGNQLPSGRLVLLIADTAQDGFGTFISGRGLTAGSFLNGDDQIVGRMFTDSLGETAGQFNAVQLSADLSAGDALAVAWFSTLNGSSAKLSPGDRYGLVFGSTPDDGDPWEVPTAGSVISIYFLTSSAGGSHLDTEAYATHTVSAIPEPSTYAALLGLAALGFTVYRRRHR